MKHSKLPDNKQIISAIQLQNEQLIAKLYDMYRSEFIRFGQKHFGVKEHIAVDIYQESFLALYQNVKSGKLTELSASLKTYLFRIGKNKMANHIRKETRMQAMDFADRYTSDPKWAYKQEVAYNMVQAMEEPCSTILSLRYWEERNMAYIANALGYKNRDSAKNRKLICFRKLRSMLKKKFRSEGLI